MGTAENVSRNIRSRQNGPKTENSPNADGFTMPKCADRRRWVSTDGINVNIPLNEVPDTASRKVIFGRVKRGDKAIAPSVEGEVAGNGGGDRNDGDGDGGDDGDGDGTTSGGSIDSIRVNTALLAAES